MAMYSYMTLPDETIITHSHMLGDEENKRVEVHFERPRHMGFDMARISLPSYKWIIRDGYSDEEIEFFEELSAWNVHDFFHYAEIGGNPIAQVV